MKRRVLALVAVVIFFLSLSAQAQEIAPSSKLNSPSSNRFSIGVNDLPWDATKISLRWWKSESKGCELSLGYFSTDIGGYESTAGDTTSSRNLQTQTVSVSTTEIRYDWLRRTKSSMLDGLYITRGIGLASLFNIQSYTQSDKAYVGDEMMEIKNRHRRFYLSFYVNIPLGLEHFFLKKYPNMSYSLEANFYGGFGYDHASDKREMLSTTITNKSNTESLRFGVTPRFYFRFYLK